MELVDWLDVISKVGPKLTAEPVDGELSMMDHERQLIRSWAVIALSILHSAPIVAAFWIGSAAQCWLAAACIAAAAVITASWVLPGLRRRIWSSDAAERGAAMNVVVGVGCELLLGIVLLAVPSDLMFG
jgi:hypothetical protein